LKDGLTAVLLTSGATGFRYIFNPTLGLRSPLLCHVLAVAVAAQLCGLGTGLVVTGLSVLAIDYYFVPPVGTLGPPPDPGDALALLLFLVVGIALSIFGGLRKRAESELRRIRYNLETAQHIASVGSWESYTDGRVWWSDQTYRIFGVTPGAHVRTEEFYDLVHPEDRDAVRQSVRTAMDNNTDYDVEHRIVRKSDQQVRYVHQQAKVMIDQSPHLIGSIKDTTDSKRGEIAQQILGGLLQVCSACRRIREVETEEWYSMEAYLRRHSKARFSHGMCPDCGKQWFNDEGKP
jgi:PAS domain-containing protein